MEMINTVPAFSRRAALLAGATVGLGSVAVGDVSAAEGLTAPPSEAVTILDVASGAGSTVTIERRGQVVLIGLDRPSAKNRIDPPTQYALARAYYDYEHDPSLRAAVVFGHGDDFCPGIDVAAFAAMIESGGDHVVKPRTLDPWGKAKPRSSKPVVVVAHGDTMNIGHELCLAADIRIAAVNTRFGQTENAQARMPASGGTIRFVREAGWAQAMRYILTGDPWNAEAAYRMGLVQELAPTPAAALALGIEIASRIAACAPLSIQNTLASAHLAIDEGEAKAFAELPFQRAALYRTHDFQEGLLSRTENRPPIYSGD
jgi:enoyl-CoA hydratase